MTHAPRTRTAERPDERVPDTRAPHAQPAPRKWWILAAVGIGTLMSALDASVVNTMLPIISRSMGASVSAIEWVVTAYLLVVSALLLGVGRAGDLYGHRNIYLTGFGIFVVSSALCAASP